MNMNLGELLLTSVVVGLHAYWFWYWGKGWGYRILTPQWIERDVQRDLQEYARVLGEMAVLTMSFLTFPVARNSVWETVFGVPFDRAIKYHRTMGVLFWTFVTLHMLCFQAKWLRDGVLIQNAITQPNHWIVEGTLADPLEIRYSIFTTL
jgi:hypothetical protein